MSVCVPNFTPLLVWFSPGSETQIKKQTDKYTINYKKIPTLVVTLIKDIEVIYTHFLEKLLNITFVGWCNFVFKNELDEIFIFM